MSCRWLLVLLTVWGLSGGWAHRAMAAPPATATPDEFSAPDSQPAEEAQADETKSAAGKFLRLSRNEDDELISMDTAIVRYVSTDPSLPGLSVDLVGVIHIGEREYYEELNKELEKYDVVLYEMVAPEGTKIEKGEPRSANPISVLQGGMKSILDLELQVDHIDYQKDHFVHADMTPEGFSKSMEERGENMLTMFFRILGQSIAQQAKMQARQQSNSRLGRGPRRTNDLDMLLAMFDRNRSHVLKQLMAEQFEDLEGAMNLFNGPDGSTIITERNKVALRALQEQIDGGKRKLAVFYGAGHMPDMEKRMLGDLPLRRDSQRWLIAWRLEPKSKQESLPHAVPDDRDESQ